MTEPNHLNICLVTPGYPPEDGGGIGTYIHNLARGLIQRGHKVYVLTKTKGQDRHESREGVDIFSYRYRYLQKGEAYFDGLAWSYFIAKKIRELDRKYHFDVIEFPNWEGVGFIYQFDRKRKPVVTRMHTPYFETLAIDLADQKIKFGDHFVCWTEKMACRKSDQLVTSTKCHRSMMVKNYNLKEEKITILPLGIQLVERPKNESGSSSGHIKILYVSRLEKRKGTITLMDAIPLILKEHPQVEFTIVGKDRPHAPEGQTHQNYFLNKYPDCRDKVRFLGFIANDELTQLYRDADIFVVPSVYESFGVVYIEAMMYAKPVIGCRAGGIPEVVKEGESGILIDPHDVQGLVKAVGRLIEDESLRKTMGSKARRLCEENFSYELMVKRTESMYRDTKEQFYAKQ